MDSQTVPTPDIPIERLKNTVSLHISQSSKSSRINKTGSWRFARPVYQNKNAPCSVACPAGNYFPQVAMHLSMGNVRQAFNTLVIENPFPATCGRVCFHTCESACNRNDQDQPVAVRCLERFVGDVAISEKFPIPLPDPDSGKRVAIVGAGPAGLSAAYFLARLGIKSKIFESTDRPGGIMQWGIPGHRLPRRVLDYEIKRILELGVDMEYNCPVDSALFSRLQGEFDAVFAGPGLSVPLTLGIPGESLVQDGLELLRRVQTEQVPPLKGRVAVIGGGNTAVDVARTLKRSGADPVIVYRRRRQDMPAFGEEIEETLAEGIEIMELLAPVSVRKEGDQLSLELVAMTPETGDAAMENKGRTRVVPVEGEYQSLYVTAVYSGIGAACHEAWQPEGQGDLPQISMAFQACPVVYGGDVVNSVQSVTHAIASGKAGAMALCTLFNDGPEAVEQALGACRVGNGEALSMERYGKGPRALLHDQVVSARNINTDYFPHEPRTVPGRDVPAVAVTTFDEVEKTFTPDQALSEVMRCYQCGFCNECGNCRIFCPENAVSRCNGQKEIDMDYCKGCGVCSVECPRSAITMEEEK